MSTVNEFSHEAELRELRASRDRARQERDELRARIAEIHTATSEAFVSLWKLTAKSD